jgi:hypothetical protein
MAKFSTNPAFSFRPLPQDLPKASITPLILEENDYLKFLELAQIKTNC